MIRVYRYKLRTSPSQEKQIEAALNAVRLLYNTALTERLALLNHGARHISFAEHKSPKLGTYQPDPSLPDYYPIRGLAYHRTQDDRFAGLSYAIGSGVYYKLDNAWSLFRKTWAKKCVGGDAVPPQDAGLPRYIRFGEMKTLCWYSQMGSGWEYIPPVPDAPEGQRKNAAFSVLLDAKSGERTVLRTVKDRAIPKDCYEGGEPREGYKYTGVEGWGMGTICEMTRTASGYFMSVVTMDDVPTPTEGVVTPLPAYAPKTSPDEERKAAKEERKRVVKENKAAIAALPTARVDILPVNRTVATSWGFVETLPIPAASITAQQRVPALSRQMQRQRDAMAPSILEETRRIREEERAKGTEEPIIERMVRRAKAARSQRYRQTQNVKARHELHEVNARKHEHIHMAHRLLASVPEGVRRLAVCMGAVPPTVRTRAARPDAESSGFHPNGQTRQTERARTILGFAPATFLMILTHEAAERGIIVERLEDDENIPVKPVKKRTLVGKGVY